MKYIPYGSKILVKKIELDPIVSSGGAFMSETDVPMGERAKIVSVGPFVIQAKVKQEIIYSAKSATEIYLDGERFFTLMEQDVWFFYDEVTGGTKVEDRGF